MTFLPKYSSTKASATLLAKRTSPAYRIGNRIGIGIGIEPDLPDWEHAEILKDELSKIGRKTSSLHLHQESSLIEAFPCTNTKVGDVRLARSVALALVEEYLGKKVTWLSLGFEFLNVSCRVECLHFIFTFYLNLHTDEVIYETGSCNKCIHIVSHITRSWLRCRRLSVKLICLRESTYHEVLSQTNSSRLIPPLRTQPTLRASPLHNPPSGQSGLSTSRLRPTRTNPVFKPPAPSPPYYHPPAQIWELAAARASPLFKRLPGPPIGRTLPGLTIAGSSPWVSQCVWLQ